MDTPDIMTYSYLPIAVKYIIACGTNNYIGFVDAQTILKYPNLCRIKSRSLQNKTLMGKKGCIC
jgi:hypothetical protein